MPRASWRGSLRLSLVSCPVYLSPATTRTKPIRLHQVWRPAPAEEPEHELPSRGREDPDQGLEQQKHPPPTAHDDDEHDDADQIPTTRVMIRPHDPRTGEEIRKSEVVKGYEYSRGQFVTFTPEELKALDVESSKVIDLETFVLRGDIDPVYFDSPYYLYPDGPIAVETIRVIGAAMAEVGAAAIGRLTLSRRERMVMVEPYGTGMALFTLRSAEEVRAPQFPTAEGDLDSEMVAIARAIIRQRTGKFDPSTFRDRYQEALRELIEAKVNGIAIAPQPAAASPPVIDLMVALKRSLAHEAPASKAKTGRQPKRPERAADRRQAALLLPLSGRRKAHQEVPAKPTTTDAGRRRKA
jgi:DNA end-binding protein Ku